MDTIGDVIAALFPAGTHWPEIMRYKISGRSRRPDFRLPPRWPPDVFAAAAHLLELSGAYHHVSTDARRSQRRQSTSSVRRLVISSAFRQSAVRAGDRWREAWKAADGDIVEPDPDVIAAWERLRTAWEQPVFEELDIFEPVPDWWKDVYFLLVAADETCGDLGFGPGAGRGTPGSPLESFLNVFRYLRTAVTAGGDMDNFFSCSFANQNIVCVMPKSRTPRVGCTLRSLSHNLALMPPQGSVRVRWFSPGSEDGSGCLVPDQRPFKILVVPFPYAIEQICFEDAGDGEVAPGAQAPGWFHVRSAGFAKELGRNELKRRQRQFAQFVSDLIVAGGGSGGPVNAVVLPEASLTSGTFDALREMIISDHPEVEVLIAGTADARDHNGRVRSGNFVDQCMFFSLQDKERVYLHGTREKHHRWKLTTSQIETYELAGQLDPHRDWWEKIDITGRSLDVMAFRPSATVTSLICEDLARVDPCQEAVRAIGPTLLVSLLMDSSQLASRWPGRYATVLAEDPGISVLTVTSLGPIRMARLVDGTRPSWTVALWRDDCTPPVEIILKPGHHAVCLTLKPELSTETTLDGRHNNNGALSWRLEPSTVKQVKSSKTQPDWIINGCQ